MTTNDLYFVVMWPESQDFIGHDHCHLINDDEGYEEFGSSAYFVRWDIYESVTGHKIVFKVQ